MGPDTPLPNLSEVQEQSIVRKFLSHLMGALRYVRNMKSRDHHTEAGDDRHFLFILDIRILDDKLDLDSMIEKLEKLKETVEGILSGHMDPVREQTFHIWWETALEEFPQIAAA